MKRGDIVLVKFPFTDLSQSKLRPALVISHERFHEDKADITLLAITSVVDSEEGLDVHLSSRYSSFKSTGLRYESIVKIRKVFTVEKKLVVRKLGFLEPEPLGQVEKSLKAFLDLSAT